MIKTKRFNKNILNKTLQPYCHSRLSNSYLSTMNNTAKSRFQNLKHHLTNDFDANYAMSACCFECLSNLSAISYTKIFILKIFREMFKVCSVVCLGTLLIKILSDTKRKNMLAFTFGLSFVFGSYVAHRILSFLLQEKKQKIVDQIDFILNKYESKSTIDFDKY